MYGWRSIIFLGSVTLLGCGFGPAGAGRSDYLTTVRSARTVLPIAREMEELFKTTDHFITHYGFHNEPTNTWNSVSFFGDRYELTMQVEIQVDHEKKMFKVVGEPVFYLIEVVSVNGSSSRIGENFKFAKEEWKKIYESGGEFSTVGIHLNPDPVPGFSDYAKGWSEPRIPVSLIDD